MAAPLDVDWPGIRAAAVAIGNVSEAARQASSGLPPEEQERFRETVSKRAVREEWLSKADAAIELHRAAPKTVSGTMSNTVQTGADTLAMVLAEDERETRLSLSAGLRKAAKVVETQPGEITLAMGSEVKAITGATGIVHRWQAAVAVGVQVSIGRGAVE